MVMSRRNIFVYSLIMIIVIFWCCKKVDNPGATENRVINYDLIETVLSFRFVDATTGELIGLSGDQRVEIRISGEYTDVVMDVSGIQHNPGIGYGTNSGLMDLALNPVYTPSASDPIKFTLTAFTSGYMPVNIPVEFTGTGNRVFNIEMADIVNLPDGISRITDNSGSTDNQGIVEEDFEISLPDNKAIVKINKGTVLMGKNGNPLRGGLHVELIHFSNLEDASILNFPGGLYGKTETGNGYIKKAYCFPAGFIRLRIWDNSINMADSVLELPIQVTLDVPGETYNPFSKAGVAAGDTIPIWRFNNETTTWSYDTNSMVLNNNEVNAEIWHTSYISWNWWWPETCESGLQINFVPMIEWNCISQNWIAEVRNTFNNALIARPILLSYSNEPVRFFDVPGDIPVYVKYRTPCNDITTNNEYYDYPDLCVNDIHEVQFYRTFPDQYDNTSIEIKGYCGLDTTYIIHPSGNIWVRNTDDWCYKRFELHNGFAEVCGIQQGASYVMGMYFDGHWYEHYFNADSTNYVEYELEIPGGVCSMILGL